MRVFLKPTEQRKYYSRWVTQRQQVNADKTIWADRVKSREKKKVPQKAFLAAQQGKVLPKSGIPSMVCEFQRLEPEGLTVFTDTGRSGINGITIIGELNAHNLMRTQKASQILQCFVFSWLFITNSSTPVFSSPGLNSYAKTSTRE